MLKYSTNIKYAELRAMTELRNTLTLHPWTHEISIVVSVYTKGNLGERKKTTASSFFLSLDCKQKGIITLFTSTFFNFPIFKMELFNTVISDVLRLKKPQRTFTCAIYPVQVFLAYALVSSLCVFAFLRRVTFERPFEAFINI